MATTQFLLQNNLLILVFITRTTIIRRIHIKAKQTCLCSCRLPKQINGINGINERFFGLRISPTKYDNLIFEPQEGKVEGRIMENDL